MGVKDVKTHISLTVLSFLMITLMQVNGYACTGNSVRTAQSGYTFETGATHLQNRCSQKDTCGKNGPHANCADPCKDEFCCCAVFSAFVIELPSPVCFNLQLFIDPENKQNFGSPRTDISIGFYSIWQPPEIS